MRMWNIKWIQSTPKLRHHEMNKSHFVIINCCPICQLRFVINSSSWSGLHKSFFCNEILFICHSILGNYCFSAEKSIDWKISNWMVSSTSLLLRLSTSNLTAIHRWRLSIRIHSWNHWFPPEAGSFLNIEYPPIWTPPETREGKADSLPFHFINCKSSSDLLTIHSIMSTILHSHWMGHHPKRYLKRDSQSFIYFQFQPSRQRFEQ